MPTNQTVWYLAHTMARRRGGNLETPCGKWLLSCWHWWSPGMATSNFPPSTEMLPGPSVVTMPPLLHWKVPASWFALISKVWQMAMLWQFCIQHLRVLAASAIPPKPVFIDPATLRSGTVMLSERLRATRRRHVEKGWSFVCVPPRPSLAAECLCCYQNERANHSRSSVLLIVINAHRSRVRAFGWFVTLIASWTLFVYLFLLLDF